MSSNKITKAELEHAVTALRAYFPAGETVATVVRHVSKSGMQRAIQVLAVDDNVVTDVSWLVARVLDYSLHSTYNGLRVTGAGMDMAFHVVYSLSLALYGDGYSLRKISL